jgi:hypothetical protein
MSKSKCFGGEFVPISYPPVQGIPPTPNWVHWSKLEIRWSGFQNQIFSPLAKNTVDLLSNIPIMGHTLLAGIFCGS